MKTNTFSALQRFTAPLIATALACTFSSAISANSNVDVTAGGYSFVFAVNNDLTKGNAKYDFGWDPKGAGAGATQNGTTVTLKPQTITCDGNAADKDTEWGCDGSGPNKDYGKNWQDILFFQTDEKSNAETSTFKGCIGGGKLDSTYTVKGFVKVLKQDFTQTYFYEAKEGPCFSIDYTIVGDATVQLQRGVILEGPNGLSGKDYGEQYVYLGATALPAVASANRDADAIPVLPLGGVLGLIAILGLLGSRRLKS
jgi:hypothetical protein